MCKPGYFGHFCGTPCPTGSFGPECGGFCFPKCSNVTCHHVHGCPENPENTLQTTISIHPKKAVKLAITSMQKFFPAVEKPVFFTKKSTTMITGTIQGLQITTGDFSANTKKDIMYETVKPESGNEFQAMLVGVGALISLFLFIIIIQHCKKSSIKRNVSRQSSNNIALHNESSYLGNRRGYNVISERPKNHSYTSFEVQYAEIPDNLELNTQSTSTSQDNYETSQSFYQNSSITDSNGDTMNVEFVEDNAEQLTISVDSSNSYLKPIFVPKIQTRPGEELKNVYINVEQE
ncbi:uncharacterized protein LOC111099513 [Crassostrea virginica]